MIKFRNWVEASRDLSNNPIDPNDIVAYARTWIGAKWKHQGRGEGPNRYIDCAGLMQRVMAHFGMPYQDVYGYGRAPESAFIEQIEKLTLLGDHKKSYQGALAIFSDGMMPCHVGILANDKGKPSVIHAEAYPKMRTYECFLDDGNPSMGQRMIGLRYFPGVKYV